MKLTALLFLMFSIDVFAVDVDCNTINELQLKMDVHASNYLNADTTRTPQGGAYKYKKVICKNICQVKEEKAFIQKFLPQHPDADTNGYVSFPEINKETEKSFISIYAKSLVMISKACPSTAKVLDNKNQSAFLKYHSGNIVSDIFNFKDDGSVVSWVRQTKDGESKIVNL